MQILNSLLEAFSKLQIEHLIAIVALVALGVAGLSIHLTSLIVRNQKR